MKYRIGNRIVNAETITFVNYRPDDHVVKVYTVDSDETFLEFTGDEADRFWAIYSADAIDVMAGEEAQ